MQTDDTVRIPLRARDGSVRAYALVDAADADWVNQRRWFLGTHGYAVRNHTRGVMRWLHREILGLVPGDGMDGDHISRDRLDNRRANLRIVTRQANSHNTTGRGGTSQHRGVCWDKYTGSWKANVMVNGKNVNLGRFHDESDAAEAARAGRARLMPSATD